MYVERTIYIPKISYFFCNTHSSENYPETWIFFKNFFFHTLYNGKTRVSQAIPRYEEG